jgi:hypothetical protein
MYSPSNSKIPPKAVIQKQDSITVFLVAILSKKYTESNFAGYLNREKTA